MLKFRERTKADRSAAVGEDSAANTDNGQSGRSPVERVRELAATGWHRSASARAWFRAFRRTRPFWGGLWLIVGGWLIVRLSMVPLQVVVSAGTAGFGGWLTGGGLIVCGLIAWAAPTQRYVAGIIGVLLAVASLILSNLGGMFLGMLFGVVGAAMVISWGPKKAKATAPPTDSADSAPPTESADSSPTTEAAEAADSAEHIESVEPGDAAEPAVVSESKT